MLKPAGPPNPMTDLYKKDAMWRYRDTGRTPREHGVMHLQVKECQGWPGNHQKLGKGKEGFFPTGVRESMALLTL